MGLSQSFPDSRIVTTAYGKVIGRRLLNKGEKSVDAFQGIPYAIPPIGDLRFKKPQPPLPWDGVRTAKSFGSRAVQKDLLYFDIWGRGPTTEDCLLLNVFTPCWSPPEGGFPVMVFIHGGGFSMDGAVTYGDIGICETLCMKDLVVVTIQYRLGYLGFWTTGDSNCPGNLGLWDQTEALKWIQLNIESFGGNKDNVTIVGQSAGGASVDFLSISPHSSGLFHKVIPMAGTASATWALSPCMKLQCEKRALKMGIIWDNTKDMMDKLLELPAEAFAISMFGADTEKEALLECTPVIDEDFLPESIDVLRAKAPPKPRMTGVAKMEGLLFLMMMKINTIQLQKLMHRALPKGLPNRDEIMKEFLHQKYLDLDEKTDHSNENIFKAMNEVYSDSSMNAPTLKMIRDTIDAHPDVPVYNYVFSHKNHYCLGPFRWFIPFVESTHCMELPFLFGKGIIFNFSYTKDDHIMTDMFSTAFANFAKFGNPNGNGESSDLPVKWEPVTKENPERHFNFDLQPHMVESYFEGRPAQMLHFKKLAETSVPKL